MTLEYAEKMLVRYEWLHGKALVTQLSQEEYSEYVVLSGFKNELELFNAHVVSWVAMYSKFWQLP